MGNLAFASRPTNIDGTAFPSSSEVGGSVPLSRFFKPIRRTYPVKDATNGPWTVDSGLTNAVPATTGRDFYAWNSGVFADQSQNWVATPQGANMNNSGFSAAMNAPTCRQYGYGYMGNTTPLPSTLDIGFVTDATEVTVHYYFYNVYTATNQNYHDMKWYADHQGELHKHDPIPVSANTAGGNWYRTMTYKESISREHRILLGPSCFIIGIYVNTGAVVSKPASKLLLATNGDSWNEPNGAILASLNGDYSAKGTHSVSGLSQQIIEQTGAALITMAHGGTGEFNCIDGAAHDANFVDGGKNTVFHGETRLSDFITKFGAKNPIVFTIGGWNDGDLGGAPYAANYQARVTAGINRWISKKSDIKLIYAGIQPVALTEGDNRNQTMLGQLAAYAAAPAANMVGYFSLKPMWLNTATGTTQRGLNTNGSDNIHLTDKGADSVANWMIQKVATMLVPANYINTMLSWKSS